MTSARRLALDIEGDDMRTEAELRRDYEDVRGACGYLPDGDAASRLLDDALHALPMARALKRLLLAFPTAHATEEEAAAVEEARRALREAGVPLEGESQPAN